MQLEQHIAPNETQPPEQEGSQVAHFGKTIASLERAPWPPSRVFCFNVGDLDRLTEILDFFGDIDPEFMLVHGGFSPEVGQTLNSAGYCPHDWKQTILYGLPRAQPATMPQGVTIEYELVVGGADFGSVSFRNQQRVGLRLGYIETVWKKLKS